MQSTVLYICSGTGLNNRYQHTTHYTSKTAQRDDFRRYVVKTYTGMSYLRKTWDIKLEATMLEALTWDYLFFTNDVVGVRYYYYFITGVEYVSDTTVRLSLEMDVLQTYMFDYDLLPCHIDRQHTETDTAGDNLVDEGLELGDIQYYNGRMVDELTDRCILVLSTIALVNPGVSGSFSPALSAVYGNTFSGLWIYAINLSDYPKWGNYLEELSTAGQIDAIVSMWMYPKNLVMLGGEHTWDDGICCKIVKDVVPIEYTLTASNIGGTVGGYMPRCEKMYTYPYSFLYVSNNSGASATYRYERFGNEDDRTPTFYIGGSITPDGGVRLVPLNYNGAQYNGEEALNLTGFPTCAWDSDTYKVWLAQNQNTHQLAADTAKVKMVGGALAAIGGAATGNVAGMAGGAGAIVNGYHDVLAQKAAVADMSVVPPQARGNLSSSLVAATGEQNFTFYHATVDYTHARQIDDFFWMYGYKINAIATPNRKARPYWTYVRTIGCNIRAELNAADAAKIMSIYDNGITFWTALENIGKYFLDNQVKEG